MADGIAKHKEEDGFPSRLDGTVRRQWRAKLEGLREKYENLSSEAARAYDQYAEEFKRLGAELGKDDDTLRGYYGKSNPTVGEFGTKVIGKPVGRGKSKTKS